jgi:hypothetical protein
MQLNRGCIHPPVHISGSNIYSYPGVLNHYFKGNLDGIVLNFENVSLDSTNSIYLFHLDQNSDKRRISGLTEYLRFDNIKLNNSDGFPTV